MAVKVAIGTEIGRGWELFKANMTLLILVGLLASLLAVLTCGILAGPMMAGQFLIIQRLLKKDPTVPAVGDLFKGFEHFLNTFVLIIVLAVISGVCAVIPGVNFVTGFISGALVSIGVMFVAFGKLSFSDALKKLMQEITTGPFWMLILTFIVANLIGGLGALLCGIGILFTLPIATCIYVCAYHSAYEGTAPEQPQPLDPPPPPVEPMQ